MTPVPVSIAAGAPADMPAAGTIRGSAAADARAHTDRLPLAARRSPLVSELDRQLRRLGVILAGAEPAACLVVGVSGGADSVALLLGALAVGRRRTARGLRVVAAHVHHHLRAEADADVEWLTALCRRFQVELHIEHIWPRGGPGADGEPTPHSRSHRQRLSSSPRAMRGRGAGGEGAAQTNDAPGARNLSAHARQLRYAALRRVANAVGARHVAVAHHRDDQFETMLMALCRGAGVRGLAGMPWSRSLGEETSRRPNVETSKGHPRPDAGGVELIRPLLSVSHAQCEAFCRAAGIEWREDASNRDATKARARLRRDVLPVLEALWPGAARRGAAAAETVRAAADVARREVERCFGSPEQTRWPRARLRELPPPLIAAGLRRAALHLQPELSDHLTQRQLAAAARAIVSDERQPRVFTWGCEVCVRLSSNSVTLHGESPTDRASDRAAR